MARTAKARSLFGSGKGSDSFRKMVDALKSRAGRSGAFMQIAAVAGPVLKYIGIGLGVLALLAVAASGHLPLALTLAGLVLILTGKYRWAALPLCILGVLGMLGYVTQVAAGGISGDVDNGFFIASLGSSVLFAAGAYLLKEDKGALALAAFIAFIEWVLLLVLKVGTYSDWFYVFAFVLAFVAVLAIILMVSERWDSAVAASVGLAVFNGSWLLLDHKHGANFDTLGDGNFEGFLFGGLLVMLAAMLFLAVQPPPSEEEKTEEMDAEDDFAPPESARPAARKAWEKLGPEGRELVRAFYPEVLNRRITTKSKQKKNRRFLQKFLKDEGLSNEDLKIANLKLADFLEIAADRFEREAIAKEAIWGTGSLKSQWKKLLNAENKELPDELGVTRGTMRKAKERQETT
jgi:hypothetical protein